MALAAASGLATFDQSNTEVLDLSDVLSAVLLADTFLLGAIGMGPDAIETTHYWPEDVLNSTVMIGDGSGLTDSGTSLVVTVAPGNLLRVGALIKDVAAGKTGEVMQVNTISTVTLTVTRGFGSTTAVTHDANATYRIISQPAQENDTNVLDRSLARARKSNYTQIFKNEIEISGTAQAVRQAGVPNEINHQIANRTLELRRELGMSVYHSVAPASTGQGSDSVYRSMNGYRAMVAASGGNVNADAVALDEGVINSLYRLIYDDGGDANSVWGAPDQMTKFANIHNDRIRLAPSDKIRGLFVNKFLTNLGQELDLGIDRWISVDEIIMGDMARVKLCALQGRAWQMQPLSKAGDGYRAMVVGEYTLEVRNALQAHALKTNLVV